MANTEQALNLTLPQAEVDSLYKVIRLKLAKRMSASSVDD
jgi:hypothetical protein